MGLHRECLPVREDELAVGRVHFPNHTPQIEANLARCHTQLGNYAEALRLRRSVVAALQKREGPLSRMSLEAARCLANALGDAGEAEEQRAVLRQLWPRLRRALGDAHATTLSCGAKLAHALVERGHACSDSVIAEAEDILWECLEAALRKISPAEWAARAVLKDADDSGNGEVSKNELESCLARRSKFRAFVTWLLRDFRGRTVDLTGLTQQVRVYLREVHDDDALTAVARRPDDTYPSVTPPRVSHDDSSLDGSIRIEISSR